jgi:hypothetical protein
MEHGHHGWVLCWLVAGVTTIYAAPVFAPCCSLIFSRIGNQAIAIIRHTLLTAAAQAPSYST